MEPIQCFDILCLPKLYTLSAGKFINSCYNKLFPNHFEDYFNPISSIHSYSTRLSTSNNLFLVSSSSGKFSLTFDVPKVWFSIADSITSYTTFIFKLKLKKHLLDENIHNYKL